MYLMNKELLPAESEVVLDLALDKPQDLEYFEPASGIWKIEDGGLVGEYPGNGGGMIYTKEHVQGNVMMDFYGEMLAPSDHDLNFVFKTEGYAGDDAGKGYICGLNGWWVNKAGIEKYPLCSPSAQTTLFVAQSGVKYHIQAGVVDGHCFMFVDGKLILEMLDPSPEDFAAFGKIGFGTYCSRNKYTDLKVYKIKWKPYILSYKAGFKPSGN